jgi:uncharacterized membrane protein YdfJ with MMPL/SSD domain
MLFIFVSAASSILSKQTYKINDVTHTEEFNDMTDSEINGIYKLSESGLTHKQKQQIIDEKSVITKEELEIDVGTVALTTDTGVYIANVDSTYQNALMETIMLIASAILLLIVFCICIRVHKISEEMQELLMILYLFYCTIILLLFSPFII